MWLQEIHMASQNTQTNAFIFPEFSREQAVSIVRKCKADVEAKLYYLIEGLVKNAPDAMFEEMYRLDTQQALGRHFNVMRVLKVSKRVFTDEFFTLMNLNWVTLLNARDVQALPEPLGEVVTLIDGWSKKQVTHYRVILEEIRGRISHLIGQETGWHPFVPRNLYLSFWFATEKLDLSYDERVLFLRLFHRFVMDRYGQLLFVVNDRLASSGVSYRKRF